MFNQFFESYLETAIWSSIDDECRPLDERYSINDFDGESLDRMKRDCEAFLPKHFDDVANDIAQAAHDFWLTRNGHGAGFWDGDWIEPFASRLTQSSKEFGSCELYVHDGKIHVF